MKLKSLLGPLLVPAAILLVPLIAMQITDEVAWSPGDFAIAWLLMAGAGLAYRIAASRAGNPAYRFAVGLAVATAFLLVWGNLAVGFIGSENHPANLIYGGVLVVGLVGAVFARLEPRGMARALLATALAQFLVPVIAFALWRPALDFGALRVAALNTVFALLFAGSAQLFMRAVKAEKSLA